MKFKSIIVFISILLLTFSLGCSSDNENDSTSTTTEGESQEVSDIVSSEEGSILDTSDLFSDRDLNQSPDLDEAENIELKSGEDVNIDKEGIFVLSGEVEDVTVYVEADDEAKVQLVLDNVSITNEDKPAIYVKTGDKVFVTTSDGENTLEVSGDYVADGDTNLDAVIFSKSDLTLNGTGTLGITSSKGNGITSKDDLKVTGGNYTVSSYADGLEANDSVRIYDGNIEIESNKDAIHSENEDDPTLGYIYIKGGTINIKAADDGIRANSIVQIDDGTVAVETSTEGIEGTYIQINGGEINVYSTDDGINATNKSSSYDVVIEVNGGTMDVEVGSGDTDGFDSNGSLYVNGGTISVTANSAFDTDGEAQLNGGEVTVNGEVITEINESGPGGGGGGGHGGFGGNKNDRF
jgi:hypothetical protein